MAKKGGARSVGSAGRFGARYGRVARRRVSEIESDMHEDHTCPECGEGNVSRKGTGIWQCAKCGYKYAGGAYRPETPGGRGVRRSIRAALSEGEAALAEAEEAEARAAAAEAEAAAAAEESAAETEESAPETDESTEA